MRRTLFCALAVLCLAAVPFTAQAAGQLQSTLAVETLGKASLTTADELVVRFSLTNAGKTDASLLRWQTPLFGLNDDLFEVTRDGEPVAYIGRHVRRPEPQAADYLTVRGGETVTGLVPLSSAYDLSRPGEYTVRYRATAFAPATRTLAAASLQELSSAPVTVTLGGDDISAALASVDLETAAAEPGEIGAAFVAPRFRSNCSTSRRNTIRSAVSGAEGQTGGALAYLNANRRDSRYTTWFGSYSASRYSAVRRKIAAMDNAIRNRTLEFDCGCTESWYAYVYANDPYKIYLCNAFWPASNADKYGTITHEVSHFDVVAASEDIAYGVSACQALARSNPGAATRNADNLAYFGY